MQFVNSPIVTFVVHLSQLQLYIMETNLVLDKAHSQRKLPNMDNTLPATAVYRFHCAQFGEVPENEATPSYVRL